MTNLDLIDKREEMDFLDIKACCQLVGGTRRVNRALSDHLLESAKHH
jgi:hypothetical protein